MAAQNLHAQTYFLELPTLTDGKEENHDVERRKQQCRSSEGRSH